MHCDVQLVKAGEGWPEFQVVTSSCWPDKWYVQDHLGLSGTKPVIFVLYCEGGDQLGWRHRSPWGGIQSSERIQIQNTIPLFFTFSSLPVFLGGVGRKTEQGTALKIMFYPEVGGNAVRVPLYTFLAQSCREGLEKTNIWVFV